MTFSSQMTGGYPSEADIDSLMSELGIEIVTENNPNYYGEHKQQVWGLLNALRWVMSLGIYCPSATTFNVRGGEYLFKSEIKTYTPGSAINPTDNDTTYIWLKPDNTIGYDIDGTGWPTTEHIKLAEIDVDSDGVITALRDKRGQVFMQYLANYTQDSGTSVEVLPVHWDKATPVANDEIRIPIYGENDADEKIEYGRIVIKITSVADGNEAATISLMRMVAGALTDIGELVGSSATQTLTNKTIDADSNTISNLEHGGEVDEPASGVHGVTGSVVGTTDAQALTNKTIDGDDNTIQDLALSVLKTDLPNADKFIERDSAGDAVAGKAVPIGDVVGTSDTQALTNKTIDGDSNTISNLAHGSEVDDPSSGIHGVTGSVVGTSDAQALTNKTIDGDDNTIQDLALNVLKTDLPNADKFIERDSAGDAVAGKAVPTGDVVGTSDTQTLTNKTIDGDDNTIQDLALGSFKTDLPNADKFIERDSAGDAVAGKAVPTGDVVGTSDAQTLTNKTIDCANNTLSNVDGSELANISSNGGVLFILTATLTAGNTVQIHNANAPFKYRVIDAWSIAKSADGGTWKLTDGTNDITNAVTVTSTDKAVSWAGTVDDAYYEIAANGSLSVVGDGSVADVEVYIRCIRVA